MTPWQIEISLTEATFSYKRVTSTEFWDSSQNNKLKIILTLKKYIWEYMPHSGLLHSYLEGSMIWTVTAMMVQDFWENSYIKSFLCNTQQTQVRNTKYLTNSR
jgi:hypothetical protein